MINHRLISSDTIDDLLNSVYRIIQEKGSEVPASRGKKQIIKEIIDAKLILTNPRARLSISESRSTPFSAFGEFLWYLSGSGGLDFIEYYIPEYRKHVTSKDKLTADDSYGPRFKGITEHQNQFKNVIELLKRRRDSKKAVIQIYDKIDLVDHLKDNVSTPCTLSFQFLVREEKLIMITNMRSNDIVYGLPHDIFAFTMIQELVARELGYKLGDYVHNVGSLHYYAEDKFEKNLSDYLDEGYQAPEDCIMPRMTKDPIAKFNELLLVEEGLRKGFDIDIKELKLDDYWQDIAILLKCHYLIKNKMIDRFLDEKEKFVNKIYMDYTDKRSRSITNANRE
ncbi:MAG TPA: thymidylate synthase [Balneolaceae bacterium]|nr:thymidylate synthase [Balneolaceae bacterium]